jgi:hypothetical protein
MADDDVSIDMTVAKAAEIAQKPASVETFGGGAAPAEVLSRVADNERERSATAVIDEQKRAAVVADATSADWAAAREDDTAALAQEWDGLSDAAQQQLKDAFSSLASDADQMRQQLLSGCDGDGSAAQARLQALDAMMFAARSDLASALDSAAEQGDAAASEACRQIEQRNAELRQGDFGLATVDAGKAVANFAGREQISDELLDDLRWLSSSLTRLDDPALQRVWEATAGLGQDLYSRWAVKGALAEELAAADLGKSMAQLGPDVEFISADRIRDESGRQLSDGLFVRQVLDSVDAPKVYEVVGVLEVKSGHLSARGLAEDDSVARNYSGAVTDKTIDRVMRGLSRSEYAELESNALDTLKTELGLTLESAPPSELRKSLEALRLQAVDAGVTGASNTAEGWLDDALRAVYSNQLAQQVRKEYDAGAGQVVRDFERLMPGTQGANDAPVDLVRRGATIEIDNEPATVFASRLSTVAIVAAPSDIDLNRTLQVLGDRTEVRVLDDLTKVNQDIGKGLPVYAYNLPETAKELDRAARDLLQQRSIADERLSP